MICRCKQLCIKIMNFTLHFIKFQYSVFKLYCKTFSSKCLEESVYRQELLSLFTLPLENTQYSVMFKDFL